MKDNVQSVVSKKKNVALEVNILFGMILVLSPIFIFPNLFLYGQTCSNAEKRRKSNAVNERREREREISLNGSLCPVH